MEKAYEAMRKVNEQKGHKMVHCTVSFEGWRKEFKEKALDKGLTGRRSFEMAAGAVQEVEALIDEEIFRKTDTVHGIIGNVASGRPFATLQAPLFQKTVLSN